MTLHHDDEEEMLTKEFADSIESEKFREKLFLCAGFGMIVIIALMIAFGLNSCTINQNMTLSDGDRSGNLKDSTETTAEPSTTLSVPFE